LYVPSKLFFTKGVGLHPQNLTSFEMALRKAGIAHLNLVQVSSIYPPGCKIITMKEGLKHISPGQIVHTVMSRNSTNEPNRLVGASVGIAIPKDKNQYGYISEHHSYGETEQRAGDFAEDLAATMLATVLGVEFDPDKSYDEKKELWRISGKIVRSRNITQSSLGEKTGLWTTVLAAVVLLP
jgi:arginine decarboxylase